MGYFYWPAGDLPAAEANYKKAIERAPDTTYRLSAIVAYSWFLFTQRRFEEAREQYRKGISERTQTDHFARYQKGRAYMFWGINERNLADANVLAEQAFQSAVAEFRGIDLEALRGNAQASRTCEGKRNRVGPLS
jgi:tetratricopeptide (TPR) repeat protein